jgi:hypothetical protein
MMADIKGDRLYVRLSASQARKRLKGLGYGVRKVESAGRNRALIIHTATGEHKRELMQLLADVMPRDEVAAGDSAPTMSIDELPNLGPVTTAWLRDVGIDSRADLERFGPALSYWLIKQRQPKATLNLLWALSGALTGIDGREITDETKRRLRQEVADLNDRA